MFYPATERQKNKPEDWGQKQKAQDDVSQADQSQYREENIALHDMAVQRESEMYWLKQLSNDASANMQNDGGGLDLHSLGENDILSGDFDGQLRVLNKIPDQTFQPNTLFEYQI